MMKVNQHLAWTEKYAKISNKVYPTELLVRILAGGNYPRMKIKTSLTGKALDVGCGDGRNFGLLKDVGFKVYGTEITEGIVSVLRAAYPDVELAVAFNHSLPYPDGFFDCIVAVHSCYYLEDGVKFAQVVNEFKRVLRPGGLFVGTIPDTRNSVQKNAVIHPDMECVITSDPFGLRNGCRMQLANSEERVHNLLEPEFNDVSVGSFHDNYFGSVVSGYMFVAYS
jgi:SAM-dependent methyltransferase